MNECLCLYMNVHRVYKFLCYTVCVKLLMGPILALFERMFVALYKCL